jgi:hypothetical protein
MKITLKTESISKINKILSLCPDTFSFVPLKLYVDDSGVSYASIETVDINGDIVFSGRVSIEPLELQPGTGMVVRLPMNKTIISTIFGSNFDSIEISKNKINAKTKNKKLSIAMYQMSEDDILEFPYTNVELFNLAVEENKLGIVEFSEFDINSNEIKDFLDCIDVLSSPEFINFTSEDNLLKVTCDDYSGNEFEYVFDKPSDCDFFVKYDMNLVKVMNKIYRFKDYSINMLMSSLLAAFTLKDDDSTITIAVTAQKN